MENSIICSLVLLQMCSSVPPSIPLIYACINSFTCLLFAYYFIVVKKNYLYVCFYVCVYIYVAT